MPYALNERGPVRAFESLTCPYHDPHSICKASTSALRVDRQRAFHYCASEDYDLCPLFLARVLRRSRPRYCGAGRQDFAQK